MADHNELGKLGEELAAQWLVKNGYTLLHRNWCFKYQEIDIIATKEKMLHFIEVKTRRSNFYGFPEAGVTKKKFRYLKNAADEFVYRNPGYRWFQYDIMSITIHKNAAPEYFFLTDVYL